MALPGHALINLPRFVTQTVVLRLQHARIAHLLIVYLVDRPNANQCLHLLMAPTQKIAAMSLTTLTQDRK
jgi:hypothetical protein